MKIISGGQTGVDRAALDFALNNEIVCGGWCPKGRIAEDGQIHEKYPLQEASAESYSWRTELNVRDSDATLVLSSGKIGNGTELTIKMAQKMRKPIFIIDLDNNNERLEEKVRLVGTPLLCLLAGMQLTIFLEWQKNCGLKFLTR